MFERVNETNFLTIINRTEGYLVNHNSKVENNNRDVVHVLPLITQCGKDEMNINETNPKKYTTDPADIRGLGTRGTDWEFGGCCRRRPGSF